jgi:phosphatidate cytidylyltransferase
VLKWRVLTALVLAPLALAAIWLLPTAGVAILFALVLALGAIEWARLIGLVRREAQALYLLGLFLLLGVGWIFYRSDLSKVPVFLLAAVWWLAALHWLQRFGRQGASEPPSQLLSGLLGYLVLWLAWFSLVMLHGLTAGAYFVTLLLLIVWGADIGAYFVGRVFGRRKLAPRVSPGKTWEGAAGGLLLALVAGMVLHLLLGPAWPPLYVLVPVLAATVLFSIVGDLFESMVKRQYGAKDSGNLLPGHGGILDRVDSLTAAAPIFVMGLLWWQMTP